jgi:hypothetical protein
VSDAALLPRGPQRYFPNQAIAVLHPKRLLKQASPGSGCLAGCQFNKSKNFVEASRRKRGNGWMVGWLNGCMVEWLNGCMVAWLNG